MNNFPIADTDLAELSELLHRMAECNTREPVQWMARNAITKLQHFVEMHPDVMKSPEQQH
ncbi:hypothetical protein [Pararobbsia alpina]|uniref:Uncharacterized protein n=1 Tax=Pararobbsia alpina TaxID=621374 RepID=A0A6S7BAI9_9BURK|nr:hypothetical protein [Pararobbsia alpina]CAB3784507.1 hypothetical protein LMG28138_01823 [Pararobbsia alpina]